MEQDKNSMMEELQVLEQHLQSFLAQKQIIQVEMQEVSNALMELGKTRDDVYKILGAMMIKADKDYLSKELEEKKKLAQLRINSIEKQEKNIELRIEKLNKELILKVDKENKK